MHVPRTRRDAGAASLPLSSAMPDSSPEFAGSEEEMRARAWRCAPAAVLLWAMWARGAVQPHAWLGSVPGARAMHPRFPVLRGALCGTPAAPACPPVQRLRGGSTSAHGEAGEGAGGEDALLAIDLGAQNTRAAMGALPGSFVPGLSLEGVATLVQVDSLLACVHACACMHTVRVHIVAHAHVLACLVHAYVTVSLAAPRPRTLSLTCCHRPRRHAPVSQNDMSKLETPTAVAFRGSKCEVGELAVRMHAWWLFHDAARARCTHAQRCSFFLARALSLALSRHV